MYHRNSDLDLKYVHYHQPLPNLIDEKWVYCGLGDKRSLYLEIVSYNFRIKY